MSTRLKFHVFYRQVYGNQRFHQTFDGAVEMLEIITKIKGSDSYDDLLVIYGETVEFEPVEIVKAWTIKESD